MASRRAVEPAQRYARSYARIRLPQAPRTAATFRNIENQKTTVFATRRVHDWLFFISNRFPQIVPLGAVRVSGFAAEP